MNPNLWNDFKGVFRALELILGESIKYQKNTLQRIWDNSSIRSTIFEQAATCSHKLKNITHEDVVLAVKETCERMSMVGHGVKALVTSSPPSQEEVIKKNDGSKKEETTANINNRTNLKKLPKGVSPDDLKISELHHKDKELIAKLEKEYEMKLKREAELKVKQEKENKLQTEREAELKVKQEKENKLQTEREAELKIKREKENKLQTGFPDMNNIQIQKPNIKQPEVKKYVPKKQQLNPEARQRKVPASRIGRMMSFGGLAAGLSFGALAEVTRRTLGFTEVDEDKPATLDQIFLTEANAERIVNTLCKVRGAALKIGQILSIQDNTVISPVLQKAFERVRQSADFMPTWQVHKVLANELGPDWKDKLSYFEEKPFAAASIGQVHYIKLKNGQECAMKIQYPGVAQGIESDINNLVAVLKIWNVFPKGLFIDNLVEVAKRELAWEVDYVREAECTKKFYKLLSPYSDYAVPQVIDELSTSRIFTSTLIEGVPVDQCVELDEEHKERIALLIMQLCLREVFEFFYMQTDPNWSNFFYDPNSRKLSLLDFGATRSYDINFVKKYIEVIRAAAEGDRARVLKISQEMGFLTGYESKSMENAHVNAVMILAEVFSSEKAFDFGRQDTTLRIQKLVPTIVAERLCPPPEEIYSLHRKLSGVFLLCAKLKVKISCREMFLQVYNQFKEKYP